MTAGTEPRAARGPNADPVVPAPWWWPALAAFVAALVTFGVTFGATYVYDDVFIASRDPRLHDVHRWGEFWTQSYFPQSPSRLYRPIVSTSYAVQWWLHGDRAWAFHLVNVLSHALVCAGVAELARRLSGRRAAYAAGLLFAVHPVHVEAVAGIVGRAELWCAGCVLAAILLFLGDSARDRAGSQIASGATGPLDRPPDDSRGAEASGEGAGERASDVVLSPSRILGILGCTVFAILSKEQGILLPFFLWFLALARLWRTGTGAGRKRVQVLAVALCWMTAGYIVGREYSPMKFSWDRAALDWTAQPLVRAATATDRWLIVADVLGRYAELMVFPAKLSLDYGYHVTSFVGAWRDPHTVLGLATAVLAVALLGVAWWRRWRVAVWCLLCAGLTYGMVGNVTMPIGTIMAERLMYLPSVFVLVLVGHAMRRLPGRAFGMLLAVLVVAGAARSIAYARLWDDRLALYRQQVAVRPESVALRQLLAQEMFERGDYAGAMDVMDRAAAATPEYWGAPFFAARIAFEHKDYAAALAWIDRAERVDGNDPTAIYMLRAEIGRRRATATTRAAATTRTTE